MAVARCATSNANTMPFNGRRLRVRSSQSTKCNHKRRSNAPSFSSLRLPCVNSSPSGSIRTDSSPIHQPNTKVVHTSSCVYLGSASY
ncbi:Uncharacterised protein [Vibrio cholerae]|nr:Uncharacterised protein [Vibrio cholerae]